MGSPAFAVPTLEALAREHDILAVFTQPDKPAGRGRQSASVPVKRRAERHNLPIHQPASLRKEPETVDRLRALAPDAVVVAAYGLILPQTVLDIPPHGCLNVHASLLPKYRGAAPIPAAILNGDAETGITIIRMDAGVDTGPTFAQAREPIRPDDTTLTLGARLADLGARLMVETLPRILRGELKPIEQDHARATLSPKIEKDDGRVDWSKPAVAIDRMARAYTPWPGAFTHWNGARLKIVRAAVGAPAHPGRPGLVVEMGNGSIGVVTGEGVLELHEVQLAGKRAMPMEAFARGQAQFVGAVLG